MFSRGVTPYALLSIVMCADEGLLSILISTFAIKLDK